VNCSSAPFEKEYASSIVAVTLTTITCCGSAYHGGGLTMASN
jgi:hypothetical protein